MSSRRGLDFGPTAEYHSRDAARRQAANRPPPLPRRRTLLRRGRRPRLAPLRARRAAHREDCAARGHRGAARLSERIKQDELRRERVEAEPVPPKQSPAYLDKQKTIKGEIVIVLEGYNAVKPEKNEDEEDE